jgi:hypothetical protein
MSRKNKLKDHPPANPGYSYIPAAISLDQYTLALYVRYRTGRKSSHMLIKQKSASHIWIECPDRDLVIVNHGFDVAGFNPSNFDKCLMFNMFDQESTSQLGLDYVMPNFVHDNSLRGSAESRVNGNKYPVGDPRRVTVIGDSGGFQYVSGKADWINPATLGKWYSKNVDAGMQLDIPLTVSVDKKQLKSFVDLQNEVSTIIRDNLSPHVDLINVTHGKTLDQRLRYKDLVEAKHGDLNRLALGGMRSFGPLGLAYTLAKVANEGKRYSQYHLLGITSSEMFPVLIAMGEMGKNPPHITSDSATHKMSANNRKQFMQYELGKLRTYDQGMESLKYSIPSDKLGVKPSIMQMGPMVNNFFTCSCPVCSNIKYIEVLGALSGPFTLTLFSIHNAIANAQYVELVKEVYQNENFETFVTWVKATHATSNPAKNKDLISALDFLNIHKDSPAKAEKKYGGSINESNDLYGGSQAVWQQEHETMSGKKSEFERLDKIRRTSVEKLKEMRSGKDVKSIKTQKTSVDSDGKRIKKITGKH